MSEEPLSIKAVWELVKPVIEWIIIPLVIAVRSHDMRSMASVRKLAEHTAEALSKVKEELPSQYASLSSVHDLRGEFNTIATNIHNKIDLNERAAQQRHNDLMTALLNKR